MGEFTTDYLAKNGRRIPIIGQLSINKSVPFLGILDFVKGSGLLFLPNLQAPTDPIVWGHGGTSNHNWGVIPGGPYRNTSVTWGTAVTSRMDYMPRSKVNPCTAVHCVHDEFLSRRHCEDIRSPTTSCIPTVHPRIHRRGDDQEGPVTQ